MARPRIVRPNAGAEVAMVIAARRQARAAVAAVLAVVERTWPETTEADVRRAIQNTLDRKAFLAAATRQALAISRANHRRLSKAVPELPAWNEKAELAAARAEAAEQWAELVERLLGPSRADGEQAWREHDAVVADIGRAIASGERITLDEIARRHDEVSTRLDRGPGPVSLLNSTMGRLRARRATNAEILETLETLRAIAPEQELAAISRVRARVLQWEARANEKHQVEAGIKRYTWISRRDSSVRPRHRELDGTIQRWSAPPVADDRTGFRAHPGGCRHCRCTAEPVINRESQRIAKRKARAAAG